MSLSQEAMQEVIEKQIAESDAFVQGPEFKQQQSSYLDLVKPIYIENWPQALCDLSVKQVDVPLTLDEANTLGFHICEFGDGFKKCGSIDPIAERVNEAVKTFPNGAFVRLGSRSPKDAFYSEPNMRVVAAEPITPKTSPLRFMLATSERMADDLRLAIHGNYAPHIFVREWIDIQPWQEFRCFMKGRELVGISQYYYDGWMDEIRDNAESIEWAIKTWFEDRFQWASHLDDVVFDVIVARNPAGHLNQFNVLLLEINPFGDFTDPCLFSWKNGGDFDGKLRIVTGGWKYGSARI